MARRRRTARQTQNITEYRRLRRNIIARLRYREKQGFKVDYTTAPKSLENATMRDIERLSKAQVKKNRYGEVVVTTQGRATRQYTDIKKEDVISAKEILKEYGQEDGWRDDSISNRPSAPVETDLDYIGMIYGQLEGLLELANRFIYDEALNTNWLAEAKSENLEALFNSLDELVESEKNRVGEDRLNAYYKTRLDEISSEMNKFLEWVIPLSEPEKIQTVGYPHFRFYLIHP